MIHEFICKFCAWYLQLIWTNNGKELRKVISVVFFQCFMTYDRNLHSIMIGKELCLQNSN
jgi:hypothetical protein